MLHVPLEGTNVIRAALFDLDGTLVDSNDAHAAAWVDACRAEKILVSLARVRRLVGMGGDQIIPILSGAKADSEAGKRLAEKHDRIFRRDYLQTIRPMPGARELLMKLRDERVKIAIASSGNEEMAHELLRRARLNDLIDAVVTKSQVAHSKPAPDVALKALEAVGVTAREAVFIGDTPYDMQAAGRAGIRAIGFLCGGWDPSALDGEHHATIAIYRDPAELAQKLSRSIFAINRSRSVDVPFPIN